MPPLTRFVQELRRRNVHRVALLYLAGSWLVLQVAEVLAELYDLEGASLRWLVPLLVVGFVPALALSWVFELSTHGVRREPPPEAADADEAPARGRFADRAVIVLLSLALTVLAVDRFVLTPDAPASDSSAGRAPAAAERPAIAVLPFLDLSAAGDQAHFAAGIAEELLGTLSRVEGLRVAARTSSFSFRGQDVPAAEIAERLHVRYLLEGSVRAAGEQLRIRVRLVDAKSGFQLFSKAYDSDGGALFDVQEDVARQVAEEFQLTILGSGVPASHADPAAHALVLEAESLMHQSSPESLPLARDRFRQAIDIDPAYARAWTGLSTTYVNMAGQGLIEVNEGYAEAREAAETALELAPYNAGALEQLAWIARAYDADLHAAARYLERAVAVEPTSPDLVGHAAVLLQSLGRLDEAIRCHEYSAALDPVDTHGLFNLALTYYFADRLEDAARQLERVLALAPRYLGARYRLGTIRLRQGRAAEALEWFEQEPDEAFRVKGRALAQFALGEEEAANAALAALIAGWGERWPSEVAHVYAFRGDIDTAFEWLEKDYEVEGAAGWGEWRLMPLFDNLHGDPRWERFLERVGVSDAQLAAIRLELPAATRAVIDQIEV